MAPVFFQDRTRMYDSLNMHSLESSLIDIMRAEQDPMKGKLAFPFQSQFVGSEGGDRVRGGNPTSCREVTGPLLPELCCFSTHQLIFSLLRA